ncbi:MAG: MMPL family transporter [Methylococcales bacterium]|nr:MMPL family transporter [Methylococcales bacterium]
MFNRYKMLYYCLPPLLAIAVFFGVTFKTDLSAFIIAGDNAEEILLASEMQSGALSRRYLLSVGSEQTEAVSPLFVQSLQQQLSNIKGVVDVWLPGQQGDVTQTIQTLYAQHSNALYSTHPQQVLEQIFTPEGLDQRALLLKKALLSPQASGAKKIALQDPLMLTLDGFKSIGKQAKKVFNHDKRYQNILLETEAAGLNAVAQSRIQSEIKSVFKRITKTAESHAYQLEMTGVAVFAVATQTLIQGDILKVSIISTVALLVLFMLIFRSVSVMFQVFTLLIIVILTSIVSTQLVFGYIHGMTVAIGSTLVGICIDYPIHAIAHAQAVDHHHRTKVITKIWPSMLMGGATTMIGYIALGISGYPGFQQVAVYAASGIMMGLLLTRFVLPRLIVDNQHQTLKIPFVTAWTGLCQRFRPWLVGLLVICLGFSALSLKSLHWLTDMQDLTPELDYLKKNDKRIRSRMTSIEPGRFILITGKNTEEALQKAEEVYPVLEQLKQAGDLTDYMGLYPWLLSAQQQQLNQSLLQQYLTDENQQRWQQALKKQGLSVKRLGQLNYAVQAPLLLNDVLKTPVKKLVDSRVMVGEQQALIMLWLSEHQPIVVKEALESIENAQYFSQKDMLNNMTLDYTQRAKKLLSIGLGLIVLLLIWRYKSLFKAIQTLLPAVIAAFLIIAVWSFTGEAISFLHLVGFLLVVAICVDYGIFYQENRGGDINLTYQAMAASMLTSALAFGSLLMAESTSLRILAGVVAFGVVLGFVFCPLIIKGDRFCDGVKDAQ